MAERRSPAVKQLLMIPAVSIALAAGFFLDGFASLQPAQAAMLGGHIRTPRSSHSSSGRASAAKKQSKRSASSKSIKKGFGKGRHGGRAIASGKRGRAALKAGRRGRHARAVAHVHHAPKAIPPQLYLEKLNQLTLKPGVVYKFCHGALNVNVVDVDMLHADVKVRPYLASQTFDSLKTVEQHARESGALVAVNANYFKKDGTPLGTIKVDGEWVSGSLFNRVAMGINEEDGDLKFARVNLHGILETSNPNVKSLWVNNMNQPRRHGTKLIVYTRRWGANVTLPYEGVLVAVSNRGEVTDVQNRSIEIPYGGYVLTDLKESELASLQRGDFVDLSWYTDPSDWDQVEHAVSGGPTLIKDGKLFVGLEGEHFKQGWTSAKITRRTACGVTADKHMILATVEGPHNMWDLAKFMQQMGCVDAMNLDGGGSTTMVVAGKTVTRNAPGSQRKVAATITVLEPDAARKLVHNPDLYYRPTTNLSQFYQGPDFLAHVPMMSGVLQARMQEQELGRLTFARRNGWLGMDGSLLPPARIDGKGVVSLLEEHAAPVGDTPKSGAAAIEHTVGSLDASTGKVPNAKKVSKRQAGSIVKVNSSTIVAPEREVSKNDSEHGGGWTKIFKPFRFGTSKNRS